MRACEHCGATDKVIHRTSPKGEPFVGRCADCLGGQSARTMAGKLSEAIEPESWVDHAQPGTTWQPVDRSNPTPEEAAPLTTLTIPDSPKSIRETLCVAQAALGYHPLHPLRDAHIARLQRLIAECDRHRPLGADGKHGDRHTPTCGCEEL